MCLYKTLLNGSTGCLNLRGVPQKLMTEIRPMVTRTASTNHLRVVKGSSFGPEDCQEPRN